MENIQFDFNNIFSHNIEKRHGVTETDLASMSAAVKKAYRHVVKLISDGPSRIDLGLEWAQLPFQHKDEVNAIQKMGDAIAGRYENVISLGIGGSYLGLKAAQDALCPPYYNEFDKARKDRPRIYFDGNNLDPDTLKSLLNNLKAKKTFVIVISKSGETTETKAAFTVIEDWLKTNAGDRYGAQVFAITDPNSGTLRKRVSAEQAKDRMSFRDLPVLKGVGGRFSELNIGLLHMAIVGIDIREVLGGAGSMARLCMKQDIFANPALMYAALHTILYKKKNKPISILMPFSETLKSTADWYVQLLAESLGKKYRRKIVVQKDGRERWENNKASILNVGRTPIPSRGTNDLHSIQQNNIEGENNKAVTFIKVRRFRHEITIPGSGDIMSGRRYSALLSLAQEATEWALSKESRPSCTITLPKVSPYYWGGLLFFFEMATAFEGELLGVNAFDQPGVEGYKNYMYYKLNKPGLAKDVERDIIGNPLVKKSKFII